jgi:hypothetical protein
VVEELGVLNFYIGKRFREGFKPEKEKGMIGLRRICG